MHHLLIGLAALAAAPGGEAEPNKADVEAVRAAVLEYVESVYQVQPERVTRSVSPELVKVGYHYQRDGGGSWPVMNFTQLRDLAANYNRQGRVPTDAPKEIEVLDVQPHIANAKLKAAWGIDYLLLAKGADGRWQIRQVMWEGNPPAAAPR